MVSRKEIINSNKIRLAILPSNLILFCTTNGIEFYDCDGEHENVVFKHNNKTLKISYNIFYRYSGVCRITKFYGKDNNFVDNIIITDDMFINNYMKSLIEHHFSL